MTFDKNEYFDLLELQKKFRNQGKSFSNEDPVNYRKFITYRGALSSHIYWENREKYVSLLKRFLNDCVSADDFTYEFLNLWRENRDSLSTREIDFEPYPKAIEFCRIVSAVFTDCDMFDPDAEENEEYNALWLKTSIKQKLLKMQEYLLRS